MWNPLPESSPERPAEIRSPVLISSAVSQEGHRHRCYHFPGENGDADPVGHAIRVAVQESSYAISSAFERNYWKTYTVYCCLRRRLFLLWMG